MQGKLNQNENDFSFWKKYQVLMHWNTMITNGDYNTYYASNTESRRQFLGMMSVALKYFSMGTQDSIWECFSFFANGEEFFGNRIRDHIDSIHKAQNLIGMDDESDWLFMYSLIFRHLYPVLHKIELHDYYFFNQPGAKLSLHFDSLDLSSGFGPVGNFYRNGFDKEAEQKRNIISGYQTLSFYDYDYFYKEQEPDRTVVDFWLAMDRYLEESYDLKNSKENTIKKDRLRNYVHRVMIAPDELLSDDEKKFREWVRKTENQKQFIEVYKKTFTGLKKIEGDVNNQKNKLLFCKQNVKFSNVNAKGENVKLEDACVYTLKIGLLDTLNDLTSRYGVVNITGEDGSAGATLYRNMTKNKKSLDGEYLNRLLKSNYDGLNGCEKDFLEAFFRNAAKGFRYFPINKGNVRALYSLQICENGNWIGCPKNCVIKLSHRQG